MNTADTKSTPSSDAFNNLSRAGAIDQGFSHAAPFRQLVEEVLGKILRELQANMGEDRKTIQILECGCGTGVWIAELHNLLERMHLLYCIHGFDLSSEMIRHAESRIRSLSIEAEVRTGNALEESSYVFGDTRNYDLIYAYDVVQQVPIPDQYHMIKLMLEHLKPGGALVVFDNEAQSEYGRKMAIKKFMRKYMLLPTVPAYFCHAKYPKLEQTGRKLHKEGIENYIYISNGLHKRALICVKPEA